MQMEKRKGNQMEGPETDDIKTDLGRPSLV